MKKQIIGNNVLSNGSMVSVPREGDEPLGVVFDIDKDDNACILSVTDLCCADNWNYDSIAKAVCKYNANNVNMHIAIRCHLEWEIPTYSDWLKIISQLCNVCIECEEVQDMEGKYSDLYKFDAQRLKRELENWSIDGSKMYWTSSQEWEGTKDMFFLDIEGGCLESMPLPDEECREWLAIRLICRIPLSMLNIIG